jgi:hypothetical protein
VITNPVPNSKIFPGDIVFVLSQTDPQANLFDDQKFYQDMGVKFDDKKKNNKQ